MAQFYKSIRDIVPGEVVHLRNFPEISAEHVKPILQAFELGAAKLKGLTLVGLSLKIEVTGEFTDTPKPATSDDE